MDDLRTINLLGDPLARCGDRLRRLSRSPRPESRAVCLFCSRSRSRSLSRSDRSNSRGLCESFLPKSHSRTGRSTIGAYISGAMQTIHH